MVLKDLYEIITDRKVSANNGSYTKYLLDKGEDKILKKVGEECTEVILASKSGNKNEIINEISDLIYHLLVLMVNKDIDIKEVINELTYRKSKINNYKGERKEIENI